jgi:hypothetical protein
MNEKQVKRALEKYISNRTAKIYPRRADPTIGSDSIEIEIEGRSLYVPIISNFLSTTVSVR